MINKKHYDYLADLYITADASLIDEAVSILKDHFDKQLKEAESYFHSCEKYGWGSEAPDMTDFEILSAYRKALRHENLEGDIEQLEGDETQLEEVSF